MTVKLEGEGDGGSGQSQSVPFDPSQWEKLKERGLTKNTPSPSMRQKDYHQVNVGDKFGSKEGMLEVKAITEDIAHLANSKGETFMLKTAALSKVKAERKSVSFHMDVNHDQVMIGSEDDRNKDLWRSVKEIIKRLGFTPAEAGETIWYKLGTNVEDESAKLEAEVQKEGYKVFVDSDGSLGKTFHVYYDPSLVEAQDKDHIEEDLKKFDEILDTVQQLKKKDEKELQKEAQDTFEYGGQQWEVHKENPDGTVELKVVGDEDPYIITVDKEKLRALGAKKIDEKRTLVFDFDGTITQGSNFPDFDPPRPEMIEIMKEAKGKGFEILIHSCRTSDINPPDEVEAQIGQMQSYLTEHGVPFDQIVLDNKPFALMYVDDKGVNANDLDKIRDFIKTASKKKIAHYYVVMDDNFYLPNMMQEIPLDDFASWTDEKIKSVMTQFHTIFKYLKEFADTEFVVEGESGQWENAYEFVWNQLIAAGKTVPSDKDLGFGEKK